MYSTLYSLYKILSIWYAPIVYPGSMPKRTKKQKLLAELHRQQMTNLQFKLQTVKPQNESQAQNDVSYKNSNPIYKIGPSAKPNSHIGSIDYTYVKQDLLRIFIFTLTALIFQGVLYFML